jgi:hypothetical protein
MYYGDFFAWLALALSGQRARTRLVWSIRCSDLDFRQSRAAVPPGARLSTAAEEILPNGIDTVTFKPDADARAGAA